MSGNPLPILIADDHLLFSQALAAQLRQRHPSQQLRLVSSLSELLACHPRDYALAIVDLSLGDGEAFSWFEKKPAVKTLVVTSAHEESVIAKLLALEIDGCVHKSDDTSCLFSAIEIILAGGHYLSPRIKTLHQEIKRRPDALHKILSPREYEVLKLVARGLPNDEIASQLGLRASTVSDHKKNLMTKLDVHSGPELMRCAIDRGLARL